MRVARSFRSLKLVAGAALVLVAMFVGEISQAIAEGFLLAEEKQMTDLVNAHRATHEFPPYAPDAGLQMLARRQTQRMAAAGYIYHNPDLAAEASAETPAWVKVGENVGVGGSVPDVEDAFLASPTHHANIDRDYSLIGLGAQAGSAGDLYFTQIFASTGSTAPAGSTGSPGSTAPAGSTGSPGSTAPAGSPGSPGSAGGGPSGPSPSNPAPAPAPGQAVAPPAAAAAAPCPPRRKASCRKSAARPARRRARVKGVALQRTESEARRPKRSTVSLPRALAGMLGQGVGKLALWR